jgi:hypothetical protein
MRYRIMLVFVILGLCLQSSAQTQAGETSPNTSTCFGQTPTPSWCDTNYNGGLGFPGWNDNESRVGLDPIRTLGINIKPANVSKLDVHDFLYPGQSGVTMFASMQMWFSTPHSPNQTCTASDGTSVLGACQFDGVSYPLAVSHLMNGAQDCPWQGPAGGSGDCVSSAGSGQINFFDTVQWGSDASTLLAATNSISGFDFFTLAVTPAGVTLGHDFPNTLTSSARRIHFDPSKSLVYADNGQIIDPATGIVTGRFITPSFSDATLMVTDAAANRAYFLTQSSFNTSTVTLQSFNLATLALVDSTTINNVNGNIGRLVRWGQNGLAFNTSGGQVFLVAGTFVH